MTKQELDEIEARANAANAESPSLCADGVWRGVKDDEFKDHACKDVRALVAEVKRLQRLQESTKSFVDTRLKYLAGGRYDY